MYIHVFMAFLFYLTDIYRNELWGMAKGTKRRLRLVGGVDCMGRAVDAETWQGSGNPKTRRGREEELQLI